ncbi:MAG: M28 family peptidase [Anaerolineales bacterium]
MPLAVTGTPVSPVFDGERAYQDVKYQVDLGPRIPGTEGHAAVVEWMVAELEEAGWEATVQEGEYLGHPIRNVVAQRAETFPDAEWIILGAHFDTRSRADADPDPARQNDPVPGANDGASGVAVLLELARILPPNLEKNVWLVFFDAEDDGRIEGKEWIMGSSFFVEELTADENAPLPDAAVIVDMIGDADLNVYMELNSDPALTKEIWGVAASLGYENAILPIPRHRILDDHIPFRNVGIPAVDMIDFDYPYWHTVEDTVDKVSPNSLRIIGETLLKWLMQP